MKRSIEVVEAELEKAREENSTLFHEAPMGMNLEELDDYMRESNKKVSRLSREFRMIQEPKFEPLSDFGDVMSLDEFIDNCKSGGFIDYDGFGRYVRDNQESDIDIYPSDVKNGAIRKDFDTIIWFNR